jgi:hypothetical protein
VLLNLVRPYKRVTLAFLAEELVLEVNEVESLLVDLIVLHGLNASLDKINNVLILKHSNSPSGSGSDREAVQQATLQYVDTLRKLTTDFQLHSL